MAAVDGGGGDGDDGGDRCRQQRWAVAVSAAADVGGGDVGGAGRRRARAAIAAKGWRGQKGWRWRLGGCRGDYGSFLRAFCVSTELVLPPMTVQSVGMVDTAHRVNGTFDSGQKTRWTRSFSQLYPRSMRGSQRASDIREHKIMSMDQLQASPRPHRAATQTSSVG